MSRQQAPARQDGMISVLLAMSMALFLVLLAAVIDLGQLQGARTNLASATSSAAQRAGTVLAKHGCAQFDLARAAADAALLENAQTATISSFEVRYGLVTVASAADCLLVATDENVGQVQVTTTDSRAPIFSASFTSAGLNTSASTTVEWGYVSALAGGLRPLSLCTAHPAYQDYQTYLADLELHETAPLVNPSPSPTLVDAFDIEVDAFDGSPCADAYGNPPPTAYGDFVNIDFSNAVASQAQLRTWLEDGGSFLVTLDDPSTPILVSNEADCGDGISNDKGECKGVSFGSSTDQLADFLPLVDTVFTIALHDSPACQSGAPPCGSRETRAYPLTGFARVELLCVRETAYPDGTVTTEAQSDAVPDPDANSPTAGSDCANLSKWAQDGTPNNDVMARLRFVLDSTIGEGHLSATPFAGKNFLGISVCAVDGDDNCRF